MKENKEENKNEEKIENKKEETKKQEKTENKKQEKTENKKQEKTENKKEEKIENEKQEENNQEEIKEEKPKNESPKIGFFKRYKYSITKIEKYPEMAALGIKAAIKYICLLTLIISLVTCAGMVYNANEMVKETANYIQQNIPEFTYKDGKITTEAEQPLILNNTGEGLDLGKVIIDVREGQTEEQTNSYINEITQYGEGILILNDKLLLKNSTVEGTVTYKYSDVLNQMQITTINKQDLVNYMTQGQMTNVYISIFLTLMLYTFIMLLINILVYAVFIGTIGYITSLLAKIKLKAKALFNMAIYALTLSITLNTLYIAINIFVDFNIIYFQVMYIVVASIYMIAAIFMLKDDVIKRQVEVTKIQEIQNKVKEELNKQEQKEEKKRENKDSDKKDNKTKNNSGNKEKTNKDKKGEKKSGPEPEAEGSNAIVDNERI